MAHKALKSAIACSALLSGAALAEIEFNGFATLAGGTTSDDSDLLHGYDGDFSFSPDSLFGLQANADLGDGLSVVGQLIARGEDDWDLELEWGYVGYELTDEIKLLAGRQRAPFFVYSDFLDVGYAYHWVAPPESVYSLPFSTIDGVTAVYTDYLGEWESIFQVSYGSNNQDAVISGQEVETEASNFITAALTLNYEWLSLRAGYAQADITFDIAQFDDLAAAWTQAGFADRADNIVVEEDRGEFLGFGATVDYEKFLLIAEYTVVKPGDNILAEEQTSWYVSGGYRLNDELMLHATVGGDEDDANTLAIDGLPAPAFPPEDAFGTLYYTTVGAADSQREDSSFWQVGIRYDFHPAAVFKLEYKQQDDDITNTDVGLVRFAVSTVF